MVKFSGIVLCMLMPLILWSQGRTIAQDTSKGDKIIIDHFGRLIEDREGKETIKWISQELQLRIDSTFIYADSAVIFGEDRVFAYGDVVIQQGDSLHVFTDTLTYNRQDDVAHLIGEVALQQGSQQLWTTNLIYYLGKRYGEYNNGGVLVDKSLQVSSKKGIYWAGREEVQFKDDVVVLHPKFNLTADSMRYLAGQKLVVFTGPTKINTKASTIYCEGGFYDLESETAEFNRNPHYAGNQKEATADTIRYNSASGEVEMLGNVIVTEIDRQITGNYLRYLENTGETWIKGSPAHYQDSIRTIVSPEIFYNEKTDQVSTRGGGEISDGSLFLKADQFDFDQTTGAGHAVGNVQWRDTLQNIGIRSDQIDYQQKDDYVLAYGKLRPLFFTIIDGDTLFISADTLNMWTEIDTSQEVPDTLRRMRAYHDVRLYKSNMQGKADSLAFQGRDSMFVFYGSPVLWSDTTQFSADTISIHLTNRQIRDIYLDRRAMIVSEILGTYYDQIKGKRIEARLDSSEIQDMLVTGNAESVYYSRDDQSAFIGVNKTISSKMFFTFVDSEIHLLKYYGENFSSLLPMHEADHEAMKLEGFQWRGDERPLTVKDLIE